MRWVTPPTVTLTTMPPHHRAANRHFPGQWDKTIGHLRKLDLASTGQKKYDPVSSLAGYTPASVAMTAIGQ